MSETADLYLLAREAEESQRLNRQHEIITQTFNFLIHPKIRITNISPKIADIATGTGIWLLDVAKSVPETSTLTGYDVSAAQFPPKSTWPKNLTFKTQSMLDPFPEEELQTYDVVAIRYVAIALTEEKWPLALSNLITLLKPGTGYLQWIDSDNFNFYNSVPGTSRKAILEIYHSLISFSGKKDLKLGLIRQTAAMMEEMGMVEVHEDIFSSDRVPEIREAMIWNAFVSFKRLLDRLAETQGSGWSKERVERVYGEALKEVGTGVYLTLDQVCVIGRKA